MGGRRRWCVISRWMHKEKVKGEEGGREGMKRERKGRDEEEREEAGKE